MDEQEFILLEDDLYRDTSIREASRHFVVFALESEWYGFDIHEVKEVLCCPPYYSITECTCSHCRNRQYSW